MQSTGQTSTQALSLTSMHGSTITYVMVISPSSLDLKRAHNPKVAGSNPAPATMNDEGLADAAAANPFRLPRLHPGIGSPRRLDGRSLVTLVRVCAFDPAAAAAS